MPFPLRFYFALLLIAAQKERSKQQNERKRHVIRSSCREFGSVQMVALCGILLALRVVLGFLEINIESVYRISFAALPVSLGAALFGPIAGGVLGGLGDIVTLIIKPIGAINPGIILSKVLSGFLMGLILYKRPVSLKRTILPAP